VMRSVAEELGNTAAVARGSYVDPRVVTAYENGVTVAPAVRQAQRRGGRWPRQHLIERATARMIRRVDRERRQSSAA